MTRGTSSVPPKAAIIITNFKGTRLLETSYRAAAATDYPNLEIIIVDCLTPDIQSFPVSSQPPTRIVHLDHDVGPAEQHNIGARSIAPDTRYIAFVDNDVEIESPWLSTLIEALEAAPSDVASACGTVLDTVTNETVQSLQLRFPVGQYARHGVRPADTVCEIGFQTGEAFVVRREAFAEVGGYDGSYFIYCDDSDFAWRLRLKGHRILLVPGALAKHNRSATAGGNPRFRFFTFRNSLRSAVVNLEGRSIPLLLANEVLRISGLSIGAPTNREARGVLQQYLGGLFLLLNDDWSALRAKRGQVQTTRVCSDKQLFALFRDEARQSLQAEAIPDPAVRAYTVLSLLLYGILPGKTDATTGPGLDR